MGVTQALLRPWLTSWGVTAMAGDDGSGIHCREARIMGRLK